MSGNWLGRPGSVLDHRFSVPVFGRDGHQHGKIDPTQRVFQGGGKLAHLVWWKRRLVGFEPHVWERIVGEADTIELVVHDKDQVLRVDVRTAVRLREEYTSGLGPRVGVPLDAFDVVDRAGRIVRPRKVGGPSRD